MQVGVRVEPVNQAFVASIDIPLLEWALALRSDWTDARPLDRRWTLDGLPPATEVEVEIAGRRLTATTDADGEATIVWDGLDTDRAPAGPSVATAEVNGNLRQMRLGRWDAREVGLGGLLLAGYDHLDTIGRRIHLGSGNTRRGIAIVAADGGWAVPRAGGHQRAEFDGGGFLTRVTETSTRRTLLTAERADGALRSLATPLRSLTVEPGVDALTIHVADRRIRVDLDDDGRVVGLRGPAGNELTVTWTNGLVTAITDAEGFAHLFEHDDDGRLVTLTRPGRGPTRLVRKVTETGRQVLVLTAEGRESSYQVEVLPDGTKVRTTRCCGRPPRVTRIAGADIEVEVGDGTRIFTDRTTGSRRTVLPSGLTQERTTGTDGLTLNGRTWKRTTDDSGTVSTSPEGRITGIRTADGTMTMVGPRKSLTLQRDAEGTISHVAQGPSNWKIEYEAGLVTRATSGDGTEIVMQRDADGWLVGQDLAGGRRVAVDRLRNGLVSGFTAPGGATTRMTYSAPDQPTSWHFPGGSGGRGDAIEVEYDGDGLVSAYRMGTEPPVSLDHDAAGLLTRTRAGEEVLATYGHEHGRPVRATTREGQTTVVTWDGPLLAAVTQEGVVAGTVERRHDPDFQLATIICGDLSVAARRDRDGLLTGLGPAEFDRDEDGRVVVIRAGSVAQKWDYDEYGRVSTMQVEVDGRSTWRVDYGYDDRNRLTTVSDSRFPDGPPTHFTYDEAGRLTEATGSFPFSATWDANGNPVSSSRGDVTREASFGPDDRLATIDGRSVGHDGAGRVRTVPGAGLRFTHDARGRLATAENETGSRRTALTRDAFGHVVLLDTGGEESLRLVPGPHGHPEAVVAGDGTPRMLLAGGTEDAPPVLAVGAERTLLLASDHLGTVRLVIDIVTGEIVDERVHDHWGGLVSRSGHSDVPFGWGCGLLDTATGLVHFPARSYSPDLLRFLSRDPLLFRGGSTNLYAFADGDPVNRRDPTGTTQICRQAWYRWAVPGTDLKEDWEHWWLKDKDGNEAGWGTAEGSGYNETSAPGEFGEVRDHGSRSKNAECDDVKNVDDECVAREMATRMGDDLGFWRPGNTCQNWVDEVLRSCSDGDYTVVTDNPDAYDNIYGPNPPTQATEDGGYTPADGEYTPVDGGALWE